MITAKTHHFIYIIVHIYIYISERSVSNNPKNYCLDYYIHIYILIYIFHIYIYIYIR